MEGKVMHGDLFQIQKPKNSEKESAEVPVRSGGHDL
jgi:hypothetical protein